MNMQQLELFEPIISLYSVFEAYHSCRKHKRSSIQAIQFELNLEENLIQLWEELNDGTYKIGESTVFVINKSVKREIFAASFRDRIVHHLIINALNHVLEKRMIYDSYACRLNKGSSLGIKRLSYFMRSCSQNYQKEGWVLKLDIQSFFMSINRQILYDKLVLYIRNNYFDCDREFLLQLCKQVIFNDPTKGCIFGSKKKAWLGLPKDKSLFHTRVGCGMPIGNLTSQVFANFYLSDLDHFVKNTLKIRYYGRYVDDFVLVHKDKKYLIECVSLIESFLKEKLCLYLHPKKIKLQRIQQGTQFLGWSLQQGHINAGNRSVNNWINSISLVNNFISHQKPTKSDRVYFRSSMNSYLGMLSQYDTYRLRCRILSKVDFRWNKVFRTNNKRTKFILVK